MLDTVPQPSSTSTPGSAEPILYLWSQAFFKVCRGRSGEGRVAGEKEREKSEVWGNTADRIEREELEEDK